jgi:hypothetical protein
MGMENSYLKCYTSCVAVGANMTTTSDHTFAMIKNYKRDEIPSGGCAHTIGTNTGEVASAAIVETTEQNEYTHQAEQFSLPPNVKSKVHVLDTCPNGMGLWKKLFKNTMCALGLFHFMHHRILKMLRKEHKDFKVAVVSFQECICYLDQGEIEKVELCIKKGLLAKVNGNKCPDANVKSKARTYQAGNVQIWMHNEETISSRLQGWLNLRVDDMDI